MSEAGLGAALAAVTEELRKTLTTPEAQVDFDKIMKTVEDLDELMGNPPELMHLDGDALVAAIRWIDVMSTAVTRAMSEPASPGDPGGREVMLAIASALVMGYKLGADA